MTDGLKRTNGIHEALSEVRKHLGPMQKQRVQSFKAFAVDDIYSTLRPLFTEYGIVVTPSVMTVDYTDTMDGNGKRVIDCRLVASFTFTAADGTSVRAIGAAEGRDYQDKATNKALQQAFKYVLIQMFQISTGEVDPEAEAIEVDTIPDPDSAVNLQRRVYRLQEQVLAAYEGDRELASELWDKMLTTFGYTLGDLSEPAAVARLESELPNILPGAE